MRLDGDIAGRVDRDALLSRVDLEALLDMLVAPADGRRRWHCPDRGHPDEHPSVTVRVSADGVQRWRCWSGGHGGTAIDAVVAARGVDVGEAMRWLAANHTTLPTPSPRPASPTLAAVGHPDPAMVNYANHAAALLWSAAGRPQRDWLAARGLRSEVLRANRVGADPGCRYLPRPKGLPGGWPAVVYPSLDPDGQIVYLQARYLNTPANRSKYDNPSAALAANPRLAWTQPVGPRRDGVLLVCEGTADALIAAQAGIRSVGVLGAAYTDRRLADCLVAVRDRHPDLRAATVVVCLDGDSAGRAGADRFVALLTERAVTVAAMALPDDVDLTEWAAAEPAWHRSVPGLIAPPASTLTTRSVDQPGVSALVQERSLSIGGIQ